MKKTIKRQIKNLSEDEIYAYFKKIGERKYRCKQLVEALYKRRVTSFADITTFSPSLIQKLNDSFEISSLVVEKVSESVDGSKKFLFRTADGEFIESVFLPNSASESKFERNTLCISSMVGCPMNCVFCASARIGYKRPLSVAEIIDQFLIIEKEVINRAEREKINNVVFMGIGEPLMNLEAVLSAIKILHLEHLVNQKYVTVSSVGLPEKIAVFANSNTTAKLAISLHSPFDEVRRQIIPISKSYTIEELLKALDYYYREKHIKVTFEYILFKGLNDRDEDVKKLAKISRRFPSVINLIPYNDISFVDSSVELIPASEEEINTFAKKLFNEDVLVITRKSQGTDISAACGQLALQSMQ